MLKRGQVVGSVCGIKSAPGRATYMIPMYPNVCRELGCHDSLPPFRTSSFDTSADTLSSIKSKNILPGKKRPLKGFQIRTHTYLGSLPKPHCNMMPMNETILRPRGSWGLDPGLKVMEPFSGMLSSVSPALIVFGCVMAVVSVIL